MHPDCFPEDYRSEISRPISDTEKELERNGVFGAWVGGALAGIGSSVPCTSSKRRHSGSVENLYVKANFVVRVSPASFCKRSSQFASCSLEQLELEVPARCENVVHLFEQFGFRMCGLVPGGLRVGQEELDVWTMIRPLR